MRTQQVRIEEKDIKNGLLKEVPSSFPPSLVKTLACHPIMGWRDVELSLEDEFQLWARVLSCV